MPSTEKIAAPSLPPPRPSPGNDETTPGNPQASSTATSSTAAAPRPSGPIEFTEVTAQAGIRFKHNTGAFGTKYLPETMGSGVCFLDYDNDGWQDIFFVNSMNWPGHSSAEK